MIVGAFNGATSELVGDIHIDLEIGPYVFHVLFQIMDIKPVYSMLLGRSWIHSVGAIPSLLHQKIKYMIDGKLITIHEEESLLVTKNPLVLYIDANEDTIETPFHAFEIAMASYMPKISNIPWPMLSKAANMIAKVMLKGKYQ